MIDFSFVSFFNICARLLYAVRDFSLTFVSILTEPFLNGYSLLDGIFVFFVTTLVARMLLSIVPS